jgi:hypothetical protein
MFKFIKSLFGSIVPFSYEPEQFVLKHEPTWYSNKYRNVYYSGNGGKSFKILLHAKMPLFSHGDSVLNYNWKFEDYTFNLENTSFSKIREQFPSLEAIEKFLEDERIRYENGVADILKKRNEYLNMIERNSQ